jgi:LAO/AO transport system kinase
VLRSIAAKGEGIPEVLAALDRHFGYLETSGELRVRRRRRLRERVMEVVERKVREQLWGDEPTAHWLDERIPALEAGAVAPFAVADALLARSGDLLTGTKS